LTLALLLLAMELLTVMYYHYFHLLLPQRLTTPSPMRLPFLIFVLLMFQLWPVLKFVSSDCSSYRRIVNCLKIVCHACGLSPDSNHRMMDITYINDFSLPAQSCPHSPTRLFHAILVIVSEIRMIVNSQLSLWSFDLLSWRNLQYMLMVWQVIVTILIVPMSFDVRKPFLWHRLLIACLWLTYYCWLLLECDLSDQYGLAMLLM